MGKPAAGCGQTGRSATAGTGPEGIEAGLPGWEDAAPAGGDGAAPIAWLLYSPDDEALPGGPFMRFDGGAAEALIGAGIGGVYVVGAGDKRGPGDRAEWVWRRLRDRWPGVGDRPFECDAGERAARLAAAKAAGAEWDNTPEGSAPWGN